jgi:hypothetical protein
VHRLPALCLICAAVALSALGTGCGEGGAASGATVSVYVAAPLCAGAQRQLGRDSGTVEDLHVRAVCLPATESGSHLNLAQIGANARRATEDSTTVAYLEASGPGARFSKPILESADIAWASSNFGAIGMRRVLEALANGGTSSPRSTVAEALGGS